MQARVSKNTAVIWDMDGVIADTAPYHFKAWQEAFKKKDFTEGDFRRTFGQRNDNIIRMILGEGVTREEIDAIAVEKEICFRRYIGRNVKSFPGVLELMKSLSQAGFKMALATSTPMENVRLVITGLGIDKYFKAIVADEDVTRGKPDPQVFLIAAERLGIKPESCVVIEDAVAGVTAAKRAGMRCVAVTNTNPRDSLGEADLVVDSLEAITVEDLERLINI
ncbi:MAG: HAD family phosphatase [Chloroflexota bacterium]